MAPNSSDLDFGTENRSDIITVSVINFPTNSDVSKNKTVSYEDALKEIGSARGRLLCTPVSDNFFFKVSEKFKLSC